MAQAAKAYLFLLIVFLTTATTAQAYDVDYAGCYRSFELDFQSIDENNRPITLSELVTIPLEKDGVTPREVQFFVLSSMPYSLEQELASTGSKPFDALFLRNIATEGALTVQLDGQGFGISADRKTTHLVNHLNARQSIDGLFAAIAYAQSHGIAISPDYYTINAGFSLAGGRAIAVQRYLEQQATQQERDLFRLRRTISGGAPISATASLQFLIDSVGFSSREVEIVLGGFYNAKRQQSMHAIEYSNFLDANGKIAKSVSQGTSPEGRALWKAARGENMEQGWTPAQPITAIHFKHDNTVTYQNVPIAQQAWGNELYQLLPDSLNDRTWNLSHFQLIRNFMVGHTSIDRHMMGATNFYLGMVDGCLRDTLLLKRYNYYGALQSVFDMTSAVYKEMRLDNTPTRRNTQIGISTLRNVSLNTNITDTRGNRKATINATAQPVAIDSLDSQITQVDAKGYLRIPLQFNIGVKQNGSTSDITIKGSCPDLQRFIQALTAAALHQRCATAAEAKKYCDALNSAISVEATIIGPNPISFGYTQTDSIYFIEPYISIAGFKKQLAKWLKSKSDIDISPYITLPTDTLTIAGFQCKVSPIDRNADGTLATLRISFSGEYEGQQISGTCHNLHEALIALILYVSNRNCATQAEAQAYADVLNSYLEIQIDGTPATTNIYINHFLGN